MGRRHVERLLGDTGVLRIVIVVSIYWVCRLESYV
jgi:hypothetical protein